MDANSSRLVGRGLWFISALVCVSVGLGALGIDLQSLLGLKDMDLILRSFVGICGVASLAMFFMDCSGKC